MSRFPACLAILACAAAQAAPLPSLSFDGCSDARGQPVPALAVPGQRVFVETRLVEGRPVLRYNPDALPRRKELTRLFLFSQACARVNLGLSADAPSPAEARRADCWGLASLLRSGLVGDEGGVAGIQADLDLDEAEWARLPGPRRGFDLGACYREAKSRPATLGAGENARLNACVHGCGDRLLHCQRAAKTHGGPCFVQFEVCVAACGEP